MRCVTWNLYSESTHLGAVIICITCEAQVFGNQLTYLICIVNELINLFTHMNGGFVSPASFWGCPLKKVL